MLRIGIRREGMSKNIVVLGAGPGGYAAAMRAAHLGGNVTLVERAHVGGTCLNWGCIPTKMMRRSADVLEDVRRAKEFGVNVEGRHALAVVKPVGPALVQFALNADFIDGRSYDTERWHRV